VQRGKRDGVPPIRLNCTHSHSDIPLPPLHAYFCSLSFSPLSPQKKKKVILFLFYFLRGKWRRNIFDSFGQTIVIVVRMGASCVQFIIAGVGGFTWEACQNHFYTLHVSPFQTFFLSFFFFNIIFLCKISQNIFITQK
jgi:hypothetical protein